MWFRYEASDQQCLLTHLRFQKQEKNRAVQTPPIVALASQKTALLEVEPLEARALLAAAGSFALYTGTLTAPVQQYTVALRIEAQDFTLPSDGSILLGFAMRAAQGSSLDPGLIGVSPGGGGPSSPTRRGAPPA